MASGFAAHDQTSRAMILWAKAEADLSAGRFLEAMASAAECRNLAVVGFPAQVMVEPVRQWSALELGEDPGEAMADATFPNLDGAKRESAAIVAMHETPDDLENVDRFLDAANAWTRISLRGAFRCRWAAGEAALRAGRRRAARRIASSARGRAPFGRTPPAPASGPSDVARVRCAYLPDQPPTRRPAHGRGDRGSRARAHGGLDTKGIATRLLLRESTVEGHVRSAIAKLDVSTRLAASIKMVRMNVARQPVAGQRVVVAPTIFLDSACATFTRKQAEYTLDAPPPAMAAEPRGRCPRDIAGRRRPAAGAARGRARCHARGCRGSGAASR